MKILEVSTRTGSAKIAALKILGGAEADAKWYSEYVFTDVSSRFLQPAKEKFTAFRDMAYRAFDFNQSPKSQGFESDFGLVIASETLHTARDVPQALRHVRELLKAGGHLRMLETTRTMLGYGLAYGTFQDYRPAEEDKDSPFLTSAEWQQSLEQTGFSRIDVEPDDYPASFSVASTILATALAHIDHYSAVPASTVYVLCPSTEDVFGRTLKSELCNVGFEPVITALNDADLPDGS